MGGGGHSHFCLSFNSTPINIFPPVPPQTVFRFIETENCFSAFAGKKNSGVSLKTESNKNGKSWKPSKRVKTGPMKKQARNNSDKSSSAKLGWDLPVPIQALLTLGIICKVDMKIVPHWFSIFLLLDITLCYIWLDHRCLRPMFFSWADPSVSLSFFSALLQ